MLRGGRCRHAVFANGGSSPRASRPPTSPTCSAPVSSFQRRPTVGRHLDLELPVLGTQSHSDLARRTSPGSRAAAASRGRRSWICAAAEAVSLETPPDERAGSRRTPPAPSPRRRRWPATSSLNPSRSN
jgi:hypothetical protein